MLLLCGFAVDFNFFTANPQKFAVRNRSLNPQIKTLSPRFVEVPSTGGSVCITRSFIISGYVDLQDQQNVAYTLK